MNGTRINWNCHEIQVTLTRILPDGTEDVSSVAKRISVYPEFGDARSRLVQSIASAVGGPVVWFRAVSGDKRTTAIPTASVLGNQANGYAEHVCDMIDAIQVSSDVERLEVFGSDRVRWGLHFKNIAQARDSLSDGTDRMTAEDTAQSEEGGLRDEF